MNFRTLLTPLAAMTVACSLSPAEVVVTIDTTFGVPCTVDKLVIAVTTSSGRTQSETVFVTDDDLPGSLAIVDDSSGQLEIRVDAFLGDLPVASAEQLVEPVAESSSEVRFLLDPSCAPGPCPAVRIGDYKQLPQRAPRALCGREAYQVTNSLIPPRNACITDTLARVLVGGADEAEAESPLDPKVPFPLFFYGAPIQNLWVGDNGYLAFSREAPGAVTEEIGDPRSLGEPGAYPAAGVLAFWDKLITGQSGVCFSVLGDAPNRILWITWERACFQGFGSCGGAPEGGSLTFSIGLEETTNKIIVGYHTMTAAPPNDDRASGQSATIGVTSGRPAACAANECDSGMCPSGEACGYTEASSATIRASLDTLEFAPVSAE